MALLVLLVLLALLALLALLGRLGGALAAQNCRINYQAFSFAFFCPFLIAPP
ncbi:MAG: hypothetical protein ABIX00_07155 [Polaromonas sp.]